MAIRYHRVYPSGPALGAALIALLTTARAPGGSADDPERAIQVGDRRQVFIDGRFLEDARGVELRLHPPRKTGELTIRPEHPWERGGIGPYSSVLKEGSTFHMWYHAVDSLNWHTAEGRGSVCYARSADGVRWEKPELGLAEYEGSKDNNIVLGHGAGGVQVGQDGGMAFLDPTAPSEQRFRMVKRIREVGEGVHVFSSPDGIHWALTHRDVLVARPEPRGHHLDTQNVIFWDERIRKYVAYGRRNLRRDGSQGRAIFRGEAARLDGFAPAQDLPVVLGPDGSDLLEGSTAVVDYYSSAAFRYPWADDAYYLFPATYYHYTGALPEFQHGVPTNAGPIHTQFAASRDGITWHRFGRAPFVGLGMRGEFDWASCRVVQGVVPDAAGREMYLYYWGSDRLHGWDRDDRNKGILTEAGLAARRDVAAISRLAIRRDGFVSVRAAYTGGELTTPPLLFRGSKLLLNVDTSATGRVRVGILDREGRPLDGRGVDDCDRIHTANETDRLVTWKGSSDVSRFAGTPIRLRLVLRDCDLYAFQFRE